MVDEDVKKDIAVIGDDEFTLGFQLIGIQEIYGEENYREDIQDLIKRDDIGIVIAEEDRVKELPKRIEKDVNSSVNPVVVTLSEKAEDENLQEKIRKVIGADIS
jgi:V/A-type H+-transporting ATPase subunit F